MKKMTGLKLLSTARPSASATRLSTTNSSWRKSSRNSQRWNCCKIMPTDRSKSTSCGKAPWSLTRCSCCRCKDNADGCTKSGTSESRSPMKCRKTISKSILAKTDWRVKHRFSTILCRQDHSLSLRILWNNLNQVWLQTYFKCHYHNLQLNQVWLLTNSKCYHNIRFNQVWHHLACSNCTQVPQLNHPSHLLNNNKAIQILTINQTSLHLITSKRTTNLLLRPILLRNPKREMSTSSRKERLSHLKSSPKMPM